MRGLHMNMKHPARKGYANGGMVRGPGTGTSDDIEDEVPVGSYILPADTTKAVGPKMLDGMQSKAATAPAGLRGAQVPVALSNGEYELTPEQVHAVGMKTLDDLKNATHTPVKGPKGLRLQEEDPMRMFFANAGAVTEEDRQRLVQQIPTGGQVAPAPDGRSDTEFSRNANNALNAMGGMGVVASVPLRAAEATRGLPGAYQSLTGPARAAAAPAADFVAGMGSNATAFANTIPRLTNSATPVLPATNAALQQGAQANAAAAGLRTAGGAGSGATALDANGNRPPEPPVAAPAPAAKDPLDGGAAFGVFPQLAGGKRTTYAMDEKLRTGVEATGPSTFVQATPLDKTIIGGGNGQRMNATQDPRSLLTSTGMNAVAGVSPPSSPSSPGAAQPGSPEASASTTAPPVQQKAGGVAAPAQPPAAAPAIYRNGNSFSDTQAGADAGAVPRGMPSAQNVAAADALAARSGAESMARVAAPAAGLPGMAGMTAPTVRTSANDWQTRKDLDNLRTSAMSITNNGGRFDRTKGNNAAQNEFRAAVQADATARGAQPTLDAEAMRQTGGLHKESGANTRSARGLAVDRERLNIDRSRVSSENTARDVTTQGAQQLQQLRNVLLDPNATPAQRKQAESSLRAIGGKADAANRYTVVPGGQEISPQGLAYTRPAQVLDNQTGQFIQQGQGQGAQLPPLAQNPQAQTIKNDPNMSREQKAEALRKMGY